MKMMMIFYFFSQTAIFHKPLLFLYKLLLFFVIGGFYFLHRSLSFFFTDRSYFLSQAALFFTDRSFLSQAALIATERHFGRGGKAAAEEDCTAESRVNDILEKKNIEN